MLFKNGFLYGLGFSCAFFGVAFILGLVAMVAGY